MGAGAEEEGAPCALWDQTESGGGTGADPGRGHGIVYGGMTVIVAGVGTGAGDVTEEINLHRQHYIIQGKVYAVKTAVCLEQ